MLQHLKISNNSYFIDTNDIVYVNQSILNTEGMNDITGTVLGIDSLGTDFIKIHDSLYDTYINRKRIIAITNKGVMLDKTYMGPVSIQFGGDTEKEFEKVMKYFDPSDYTEINGWHLVKNKIKTFIPTENNVNGQNMTRIKPVQPTPPTPPGPEPEPTTGTDVDYITVEDNYIDAAYNNMSVDINDKVNTQDAVIFYDGINYKPNNDTYYYEDPDVKYCYIEIAVDSHSTSWGENKSVYLPGTGNPWFAPAASFPADGTRIRVYNHIDENRGPITVQTENWVGKDYPIENPPSIDRRYYVDVVYSASEQRYIVVRIADDSD